MQVKCWIEVAFVCPVRPAGRTIASSRKALGLGMEVELRPRIRVMRR